MLKEFSLPAQIIEQGATGIVARWKKDKLRVVGIKRATELVEAAKTSVGVKEGIAAEVGDITRFEHSKQIQKLAGLSLKENSSEKHKGKTTISKRGRSRLRVILFQGMLPLVAQNEAFKELHQYYTAREENRLRKKQSLILLCCKLIRIFHALMTKQTPHEPKKMMNDIKRNPMSVAA